MSMHIAPGILQDTGSAGTTGYTPEIWADDLVTVDYDVNTFEKICETTGKLSEEGDSLIMTPEPIVTVRKDAFGPGGRFEPTVAVSTKITMPLDRTVDFAPEVDAIQESQMKRSLGYRTALLKSAAIESKNAQDEVILQSVWNDADVNNTVLATGAALYPNTPGYAGAKSHRYNIGGLGNVGAFDGPLQLTPTNLVDWLTYLSSVLGEANVPMGRRWVILPEWIANLCYRSDLKNASMMGIKPSILADSEGLFGADGRLPFDPCMLKVYVNEHLSTPVISGNTCTQVLFGGDKCVMYGSQLKIMKAQDIPLGAGQVLTGLITYGFKTHRPTRLGMSVVY